MNFSVPNIDPRTLLEFLTAKGWRVVHVGPQYAHLLAPKNLAEDKAFFVPLQKGRELPVFGPSMDFLLRGIAGLYQMDPGRLQVILSSSVPRLNADFMAENKREGGEKTLVIKDIDRY